MVEGLLQQKLFFEDQVAGNRPSQSHYHLDSRDGSEPIKYEWYIYMVH